MRKVTNQRVNVSYSNVESVSSYFSDNGEFGAFSFVESTADSISNSASTRFTTSALTEHYTENTAGTLSLGTSIATYSTSGSNGSSTLTNTKITEENFLSTTGSAFSELGATATFTNRGTTGGSSTEAGDTSDRFNNSSAKTRSFTKSSTNSLHATGEIRGFTVGSSVTGFAQSSHSQSETKSYVHGTTSTGFTYVRKATIERGTSRTYLTTETTSDGPSTETTTSSQTQTVLYTDTGAETADTVTANTEFAPIETKYTYTTGTSTFESEFPDTFEYLETITLTNESNIPSTFSYAFLKTTWISSLNTTITRPAITTDSSETFVGFTVNTTQQIVTSFYQEGDIYGYVPIESIPNSKTFDFKVSNLTSSISYWSAYLRSRNEHSTSIALNSNSGGQLPFNSLSTDGSYNTVTITTTDYSTEELTNIVTTESPTFGLFSFGKTTSLSTGYSTETDSYYDYENISTGTQEVIEDTYFETYSTGFNTIEVSDLNDSVLTTATYYGYSSKVYSSTDTFFAKTSTRIIGFPPVQDGQSKSSTFLFINRDFYPFFSVHGNDSPNASIFTRWWGGLNGFQIKTSTKITGIPTLRYTDQYVTTGTKQVTDIKSTESQVNTTTSYGSTTTNTTDSFRTTTTFTSKVTGNVIETTSYELPLYDTSYKLNRYYTFIPTSGTWGYIARDTSLLSTNGLISATNTHSQVLVTASNSTDQTFSYSSLLFGKRKVHNFGGVTTREIPYSFRALTLPFGGEDFADSKGSILLTANPLDRDFDPTIFTGSESNDYITFDFSGKYAISKTIPKHKIIRLSNTHGAIKYQDAYSYENFEGDIPAGPRLYPEYNQFPLISLF